MTTIAKIHVTAPLYKSTAGSVDHDDDCEVADDCHCDLGIKGAFVERGTCEGRVAIVERDGALYFTQNDGPLTVDVTIGSTTLSFDGKGR